MRKGNRYAYTLADEMGVEYNQALRLLQDEMKKSPDETMQSVARRLVHAVRDKKNTEKL